MPDLPARLIYEDVLPSVVSRLCDDPPVPYHPGSPYGGQGWDTSDPTVGDVHQWDIWAGKERPWQEYAFRNGRFVRYAQLLSLRVDVRRLLCSGPWSRRR